MMKVKSLLTYYKNISSIFWSFFEIFYFPLASLCTLIYIFSRWGGVGTFNPLCVVSCTWSGWIKGTVTFFFTLLLGLLPTGCCTLNSSVSHIIISMIVSPYLRHCWWCWSCCDIYQYSTLYVYSSMTVASILGSSLRGFLFSCLI